MEILIPVVLAGAGAVAGFLVRSWVEGRRVNSSERLAERVVEDARREAESLRSEATLKARDAFYEARASFEAETKEERSELRRLEHLLLQREETLERRGAELEARRADLERAESVLEVRERQVAAEEGRAAEVRVRVEAALERASGLRAEDARRAILERVEAETRHEAARAMKRVEEEARGEAEKRAKRVLSLAICRYAGEYVSERTVSVVHLPGDEMKGRIIGREGRNIRALEGATGVDVIIDETPEAVLLSSFDPLRREIAKISLERLIQDGRIHPARIEETVEKVRREIDTTIREAGEQATFDIGAHGLHPELIRLLGRLRYRTSYTQNQYNHALEVAWLNGIIAAEMGLDEKEAKRAGLLHDIGKAVDHEVEGPHAAIGAELARKYGEPLEIVRAIGGHHDPDPPSLLAIITQASDALSGARPGARKQVMENYIQRLRDLEATAAKFPGVENAYAIQAGRELRVIVSSAAVSDEQAYLLSRDIARQIERDMTYPGQVKVTVIRETRAVGFAR
jgi:ribonuclease Y